MARDTNRHRRNVPDYRLHHSPRATRGDDFNPGGEIGPPSSAAESLIYDADDPTVEGPLVASKDEHEKAIG